MVCPSCASIACAATTSPLCLAAARRPAVGGAVRRRSSSSGATGDRKTPASLANSGHLLVLHFHESAGSPAAALGNWLLVCGKVECQEEEQVRRNNADARDGGKLLASALAHVGHVGPVGAGEVGPRRKVDEA